MVITMAVDQETHPTDWANVQQKLNKSTNAIEVTEAAAAAAKTTDSMNRITNERRRNKKQQSIGG